MPTEIRVTAEDVENLARKLDEFAEVLDERERMFLLGVFGVVGKSMEQVVESAAQASDSQPEQPIPSVSVGFREAFAGSVGAKLTPRDRDGA